MERPFAAYCICVALGGLVGCADDLVATGADDAGITPLGDGNVPAVTGKFRHVVGDDGTITTMVDATSMTELARIDLDDARAVEGDGDDRWDLAFQRFFVRTNGGVSGAGGGAAAEVAGTFDALEMAPETGWTIDGPDTEADTDEGPDTAFNGGPMGARDWYDYDPSTHRLTARDRVYVVRANTGRFYKVQLLDYYDDAGTPAMVRFAWKEVRGGAVQLPDGGAFHPSDDAGVVEPDAAVVAVPADAITVASTSASEYVYVSATHGVVEIADPATSLEWDLAIRGVEFRTNSGASGPGWGGARLLEGEHHAIASTDTLGFRADEVLTSSRPGSEPTPANPVLASWYDYDPVAHVASPKANTFGVRTARGDYVKLRIWTYSSGTYQLTLTSITPAPERHDLEIDASGDTWVYVDLHAGEVIAPASPDADPSWDLAVNRTLFRTNSGVSGAGRGGAALIAMPYGSVREVPTDGYVVDTERTIPGPPGSPTYDGNEALEAWYDYDPSTHAITPKDVTFALRLADESAGKLAVVRYADGRFSLAWTYAGPGRRSVQ